MAAGQLLRLYPSALDFSLGGMNLAEYNSGCWRYILYTQGVRNQIDQAYQSVGAHHEEWYESTLTGSYEREVPFKIQIGDAVISGRCDFKMPNMIDETKSTFDEKKVLSAPSRVHLAQLSIYLMHFEMDHGQLVYGSYVENAPSLQPTLGKWKQTNLNKVQVSLNDGGGIKINGIQTEWKADDVVNTAVILERHYREDTVPERPPVFGFKHACKYCPAAMSCAKYEAGELDKQGLKDGIRMAAMYVEQRPAKWKKEKDPKPLKTTKPRKSKNVTDNAY